MPTDTSPSISSNTFCDFHGIDNFNRFVINKKFGKLGNKTYDEWHAFLQPHITLGEKKDFQKKTAPAQAADVTAASTDNTKK